MIACLLCIGLALLALIFGIIGAARRNRCLSISAIVIGSVFILLALGIWITGFVFLGLKNTLESKYCGDINTVCCTGSYLNYTKGYSLFTCGAKSCVANPFLSTVSGSCSGSLDTSSSTTYSNILANKYSSASCSGSSSCYGWATEYNGVGSVCSDCSYSVTCTYIENSETKSKTFSDYYQRLLCKGSS